MGGTCGVKTLNVINVTQNSVNVIEGVEGYKRVLEKKGSMVTKS